MSLIRTRADLSALVLRLSLAVVFFPHAAQKVFGWFGGPGLHGTLHGFTSMGLPLAVVWLVIAAEMLGAIGLFIGFLGRIAAFGIFCDMIGAISLVHAKNGFFMNWSGRQPGEGFEFHLLVLAIALALMIKGSGLWSVDRALTRELPAAGDLDVRREHALHPHAA